MATQILYNEAIKEVTTFARINGLTTMTKGNIKEAIRYQVKRNKVSFVPGYFDTAYVSYCKEVLNREMVFNVAGNC